MRSVEHEAARRPATAIRVRTVEDGASRERPDRVITEEPMEIRLEGPRGPADSVAVTMRTPGADFELAVGFLITEGVITDPEDIASVAYCLEGEGEQHYNVVTVHTRSAHDVRAAQRSFTTSSSCGVCGKTTLDDVEVAVAPVAAGPVVPASVLTKLPDRLRAEQTLFDSTGGVHAAALSDVGGDLVALREDVGRHNALDKLIGNAALERRLPMREQILMVSGRVSFEIVQKAAVAGIPIICAVSAPSSLAVDAARRLSQTVVGFLRDERFNVYSGPERVDVAA